MAPYSLDLRQKILRAHAHGRGSQRALAELFGVSVSFIEKLLHRHRTTGEVSAKPHGRGPKPRLDARAEAALREWVTAQPDRTLAELGERLAHDLGVQVSVPVLCRTLQRLGLPRKKSRSTRPSATASA
jgi:transposase